MILEGDKAVISALKEKKRLMDAGESHDHLKLLCICDGGLMKGAYSVGVGLALEELGYTNVFTDFVGVSSGAPSAAYFLGGNVHEGGSLIYEECCSKKFLNSRRFWSPANINFLIDVLRGKTDKMLRFKNIFNSPTRLHIGVSEAQTAKPQLFTPTNEVDLLAAIKASVLIPSMTSETVVIDGIKYMDGGFASPHILHQALTTIDFTHVLILTSQNFGENTVSWFETFLNVTIFRLRTSKAGRRAIKERRNARQAALDALRERKEVSSLLVWGDGSIEGTERDATKVKMVVERSRQWWHRIMSEN